MKIALRDNFLNLWEKYFNNAEPPIVFYYTDMEDCAISAKTENYQDVSSVHLLILEKVNHFILNRIPSAALAVKDTAVLHKKLHLISYISCLMGYQVS